MSKKNKEYITNTMFIKKNLNTRGIILNCLSKVDQNLELQEDDIKSLLDCIINHCDSLENIIEVLNRFNVKFIKIIDTQKLISNQAESHAALLVKFGENEIYLIDPNYKKFFLKENCKPSIYNKKEIKKGYIYNSPHPGYYYLKNPEMLPIAEEIIEKGYIKFNPVVAKAYVESFFTTKKGPFMNWKYLQKPMINSEIYVATLMMGDSVNSFTLKKEQR